jgi:hypothetical protein
MRVHDRNAAEPAATSAGKAQETQRLERESGSGAPARSSAGSDHVELSTLTRALNASAAARSQLIGSLSADYQAGRYNPDPAQVSHAMVSEALAPAAK